MLGINQVAFYQYLKKQTEAADTGFYLYDADNFYNRFKSFKSETQVVLVYTNVKILYS